MLFVFLLYMKEWEEERSDWDSNLLNTTNLNSSTGEKRRFYAVAAMVQDFLVVSWVRLMINVCMHVRCSTTFGSWFCCINFVDNTQWTGTCSTYSKHGTGNFTGDHTPLMVYACILLSIAALWSTLFVVSCYVKFVW